VIEKERSWLLAHADEDLSDVCAIKYLELVERRYAGEPIQYITGQTEFYGLPFRVTPAVLIPRPETEHLVEKVLALAASFTAPRIVDVGAGSGAISITLALHLPQSVVTAIDLSPAALDVARQNAALNGLADMAGSTSAPCPILPAFGAGRVGGQESLPGQFRSPRIRFLQGDLLAPVADEQFEIVVSNPPYVPLADRSELSVEVREHEPALALFAGDDGLLLYRRLISEASSVLVPGGWLLLEIGYGQEPSIRALLTAAGFAEIEFFPDLRGIARVAMGRKRHG